MVVLLPGRRRGRRPRVGLGRQCDPRRRAGGAGDGAHGVAVTHTTHQLMPSLTTLRDAYCVLRTTDAAPSMVSEPSGVSVMLLVPASPLPSLISRYEPTNESLAGSATETFDSRPVPAADFEELLRRDARLPRPASATTRAA